MAGSPNSEKVDIASRRTILQAAGTIGAAGLTTLAGCVGGSNDESDIDVPDEYVEEEPAGDPVEVVSESLDADFPVRNYYAEQHANIMDDIGFDVEHNVRALQAFLDETQVGRNQDINAMRYLDSFDPERPISDCASRSAIAEGGGNIANHYNPEYEELLDEQSQAVDDDERQELVYEAQEYLVEEEYVVVPIMYQDRAMPYDADTVSNIIDGYLEDGLTGIYNMVQIEVDDEDNELIPIQHEDLNTLDPLAAERGRADRDYGRLIFDRLMHPDPDNDYLPEPWAAEEVEQPDEETYVVTLQDDLEWHDGEPVTAEDVEFTYTYGPEHSAGMAGVTEHLDEVEVTGDLEATFHMEQPDATFLATAMAGRDAHLIPQHILEDVDDPSGWDSGDDIDFVGSGPFQLSSWDEGEELVLDAFEGHHQEPNIDRVIRLQGADAAASASAMEDGTADMLPYDLPPDQLERLDGMDHLEIAESPMTSMHYYSMNMDPDRDGPFRYREVREAISYTFDRQEWIDVAAAGFGEELNTIVPPALEFWSSEDVSTNEFDVDQCVEVLGEAGFVWNEDGQLHYPEDTDHLTTQRDTFDWDEDDLPEMLQG